MSYGRVGVVGAVCAALCGCGGDGAGSGYVAAMVAPPPGGVAAAVQADPLVQVVPPRGELGWASSPDEEAVARYEVFAVGGGVAARLGVVGVATHEFSLAGLRPGRYSFYVVAVGVGGDESVASPSVTAEVR